MKSTEEHLKKKAKKLRKEIITMSFRGRGSHISSCLSIADILTVLYFNTLKIHPKKHSHPKRDRFILSKGHAACALYVVLAHKGFFPKEYLETYGCDGTLLGAHPEYGKIPGIELSTGSLGHGLSVGTGMALAAKLDGSNHKVFVLLSDGECNEGSVWEAALFAGQNRLNNLVVIIDYNKLQAFGRVKNVIDLEPFYSKWESFGWAVKEVDGHNHKELLKVINSIPLKKDRPTTIITHTIAGKGVSFLENKLEWHYLNLTEEQYRKAIEELDNS